MYQILPMLHDLSNVLAVCDDVDKFNTMYHRKVEVFHGATRIVLVTSDYVVKFDFGMAVYDYGGCEDEVNMYNVALGAGYAHLFAPITRIVVHGYKFYVMPRVHGVGHIYEPWNNIDWDDWVWLNDHVGDLHNNNWGILHNTPIVIDYACSRDREEEEEERSMDNWTPVSWK